MQIPFLVGIKKFLTRNQDAENSQKMSRKIGGVGRCRPKIVKQMSVVTGCHSSAGPFIARLQRAGLCRVLGRLCGGRHFIHHARYSAILYHDETLASTVYKQWSCVLWESTMSTELSSITEWADKRTAAVYTAKSKTLAKLAVEELFAPHVKASINGRKISREEIDQLLLDMRPTEEGALGFYWTDLVGVPRDPSHRVCPNVLSSFVSRLNSCTQDGSVSGMFIISGLQIPDRFAT